MKTTERNWTLLPFCIAALITAGVLCAVTGWRGRALAGMFLALFCAAFLAWLLAFVLFLAVAALLIDDSRPQTRYEPFYHAMVTFVEGLLPALARVRIHVSGAERVPDGEFLLVGNHRSDFDPLITGWVLRRKRFSFILKPSIRRLPVVGPFVHRACYLAIDRENDRAALKTILEAASLMKQGVVSFGIYPEGTRNAGEGLLPFRNGAFKIAQKAKTPIVVAAIQGTEAIRKNFPWRPTDVRLEFCGVIGSADAGRMNTGEIGEEVRKCITFAGS